LWRELTLGIANPEGSNSPLRLSGAKPTDEQRGHKLKTGETPNGHDEQETSVALVLRPPLPGDKRESTERNQKYGTILHNLTYLVVSAGRANFPVFLQFSNFSLHLSSDQPLGTSEIQQTSLSVNSLTPIIPTPLSPQSIPPHQAELPELKTTDTPLYQHKFLYQNKFLFAPG
jgi:hypothetical protein